MKKRFKKSSKKTYILLTAALVLIGINVINNKFFTRADLTRDNLYSITSASKTIANDVEEPITIETYISKQLPSNLFIFEQRVTDILSEYTAFNNGNIQVKRMNPEESPEKEQELQLMGIPKIQFNVVEKDKLQVQSGFFGLAIRYKEKTEVLPVVQDATRLEYDITSAMVKLIQDTPKRVGFLQGEGARNITQQEAPQRAGYTQVATMLNNLYDIVPVQDTEENNLIQNIDTLIVAGTQAASPEAQFAVDQFITHGGNAIFLLDTVNVNDFQPVEVESHGFENLLASYGVTIGKNMVADQINETAVFSQGTFQYILPYPLWPKLIQQNFETNNPIVSSLESIVMPWASSLQIEEKEGIQNTILASTHASWLMESPYVLDPNVMIDTPKEITKEPMIAMLRGNMKSIYEESDLPVTLNEGESFKAQSEEENIIIVAGDSDFLDDAIGRRFQQNAVFLANAVDFLTLGNDLVNIRTKTVLEQSIKTLTDGEKTALKLIGVWLSPVIIAILGAYHLIHRRRRKYALDA